jgi:hypothetical protein
LADNETNDDGSPMQYEHGIPIINARLGELDRKAAAAEARDTQYKNEQVTTNRRLATFTGLLVATSLMSGVISILLLIETKRSAKAAGDAANAAIESTNWIKHQTINAFENERPRIWIKVPETIQIKVGEPINPHIQVFNYGRTPGIARARIQFKAAPGVIEEFRNTMRYHRDDFTIPLEEQTGTLKLLINPNEGRQFPIESPELKLSSEDIKKLADGTIDVAIYGRIFYTDLSNSATGMTNEYLKTLFCFYVLRDGTTISACPNRKDAYTNWAP